MKKVHLLNDGGYLEVFTGPMKCGKSHKIHAIADELNHRTDIDYKLFKPKIDDRSEGLKSRFSGESIDCIPVDTPDEIENHLTNEQLVGIDEAQFFDVSFIEVVESLLEKDLHIIIAGLDLDFRGEPFGPMPLLLSIADEVHKLHSVCDYDGCNKMARYTQRLVNDKPARYDEPTVSVEGDKTKERYEARCLKHHKVPAKPSDHLQRILK